MMLDAETTRCVLGGRRVDADSVVILLAKSDFRVLHGLASLEEARRGCTTPNEHIPRLGTE